MARRTAARAATPWSTAVPEALLSKPCALWPWSASSRQRSVAIGVLAVAGYHPSLLAAPLDVALRFAAARVVALAAHEAAHAAVALALGASVRLRIDTAARRPCTLVEGLATPCGHAAVRHAGWIASVALALLGWAMVGLCSATTAAAWWTALDPNPNPHLHLHLHPSPNPNPNPNLLPNPTPNPNPHQVNRSVFDLGNPFASSTLSLPGGTG